MNRQVFIQRLTLTGLLFGGAGVVTCAPAIRVKKESATAPLRMAELWTPPANQQGRDLYYGVGGQSLTPAVGGSYRFLSKDTTGFSPGYDVTDARGMEWSVKTGPEAQAEVAASRLVWAVGYHQPPTYYVPQWTLEGGDAPGPQAGGRFRPKLPWQKKVSDWSWHQNPFVGTVQYRGLLVLMIMLTNSDLKPSNNALYELTREVEGARRWYIVRDVGHSFGETGAFSARRSDVQAFEKHDFITGVNGSQVKFDYRGLHDELLGQLTTADVRWICDRLALLTERQWSDTFRAAGYPPGDSTRFIRKFREKIDQGLRLPRS